MDDYPEDSVNTTLRPKFLFMDVSALVAFPIWLFHMRTWTFVVMVLVLLVLLIIQWRGVTPLNAYRICIVRVGALLRWSFPITRRSYPKRLKDIL